MGKSHSSNLVRVSTGSVATLRVMCRRILDERWINNCRLTYAINHVCSKFITRIKGICYVIRNEEMELQSKHDLYPFLLFPL
jgi:hypothetical protein